MSADKDDPQDRGTSGAAGRHASYKIETNETKAQALAIYSGHGICIHVLVCIGWIAYLYARLLTCLHAGRPLSSVSTDSWLVFFCEMILAAPDIFQILELSLSFAPGRSSPRALCRLLGDEAPTVHIFITTCGEDLQVVMDTVAAAAFQQYPKHCYRVFVLDDAHESALQDKIEEFNRLRSAGIQPVVYLSRSMKAGTPHYYKAGNLSYGIRMSEEFGNPELIAGLDADMIAESDWLQRTVPHLVLSPELAMVSPPQYSYNVPAEDPLAQDANVLQQILEPARDRIGCGMCHGSGYVLRREALGSISGWPQVNIGEDILCSYMLNQAGWQTAFIEDRLQFGTTCDSFHAYVSQRMRWTGGNLLSAHRFRFFLPYIHRSRISKAQRLHGLMQSIKTYFWAALTIPLVLLPASLLSLDAGRPCASIWDGNLVRYTYAFLWLTTKAWKRMVLGHVGATNALNLARNRLWITPYIVCGFAKAWWVDLANTKFEVSGTFKSPLNERSRSPTIRASLWKRMTDPLIMMHTVYWLIALGAILARFASIGQAVTSNDPRTYPEAGIMCRMLEIALAALVPVSYMLFPTSETNRRDHLTKDASGTYRASVKDWTRRDGNAMLWVVASELLIIFSCDWLWQ